MQPPIIISGEPTPPPCRDQAISTGVILLIIPVEIDVNQLIKLGKKFIWVKNKLPCPKCGPNRIGRCRLSRQVCKEWSREPVSVPLKRLLPVTLHQVRRGPEETGILKSS